MALKHVADSNRMTLEDFCKLYSDLDICGMDPSFLDETSGPWKSSVYEGRWVLGTTAGGCMNHKGEQTNEHIHFFTDANI